MSESQNNHERPVLADVRREQIGDRLRSHGSVSVSEIESDFGVSAMTARRDLAELERRGLARRTHGGAVIPPIAAHEDSFASRVARDTQAKSVLGAAAATRVGAGESVFLDSSSTAFHVAAELLARRTRCTLITNSLAILQHVAGAGDGEIELIALGGPMRDLTQSFVGPRAVAAASAYYADRAFFSVKGITADGLMTDADGLEAEVKRAMISHSQESVLLVDRTKLESRGLSVIGPVSSVHGVLAHGMRVGEVASLRRVGARVEVVQ